METAVGKELTCERGPNNDQFFHTDQYLSQDIFQAPSFHELLRVQDILASKISNYGIAKWNFVLVPCARAYSKLQTN